MALYINFIIAFLNALLIIVNEASHCTLDTALAELHRLGRLQTHNGLSHQAIDRHFTLRLFIYPCPPIPTLSVFLFRTLLKILNPTLQAVLGWCIRVAVFTLGVAIAKADNKLGKLSFLVTVDALGAWIQAGAFDLL